MSLGNSERIKAQISSEISLASLGLQLSVNSATGDVVEVVIDGFALPIAATKFEPLLRSTENSQIEVVDFSDHPINMKNRYGSSTDQERITQNQDQILITKSTEAGKQGWSIPRKLTEGALISRLDLSQDQVTADFTINLFEMSNGQLKQIEVKAPTRDSRILHATQILGHVKDACDMQVDAHEKGLLQNWVFAFPPTKRTTVNQQSLVNDGIPTHAVTTNWSYGPESEELPSDFSRPESFPTILGFLAANSELCRQVAEGRFSVISTNFKQEGGVLKMINPDVSLTGINFTFLSGTPGERIAAHEQFPTFQVMLDRVQASLNAAPAILERIVGEPVKAADWWELVGEKLQNVDILFYRTFSFDPELPDMIGNTLVVQIPHPIPEVRLSKEASREHISLIINREIAPNEKIILLPGASEDGLFQQRAEEVFSIARKRNDVVVLMPLSPTDQRLEGLDIPENVFPIGFREDWMDILPGADTTIIRGSWGEILDVVAAGVVPIISSPGTVAESGDPGYIQFLSEVSGERAVNLSLFIEELSRQGVPSDVLNSLLADIADSNSTGTIAAAIDFALNDEVIEQLRSSLFKIEKDGIPWMVDLHELLRREKPAFFKENIAEAHQLIWSGHGSSQD